MAGELGDVDTTPYARVSYMAYYYDEGERLSDVLDVGSNGGDAYTRPGSVPTRSDTERVWSYAYNDAGWLEDTTDPRGIVTHQDYNNLGWLTRTVEAYSDGTPSAGDDRTTEYTYNGTGNVLTVKAVLPSSAIQETAYVYASRIADGSVLNSNDVLSAVRHPDASTGAASANEEELYTVNALGQTATYADRNGTEHTYSYDVVGRLTSDTITELGSGVDDFISRLDIAYDTGGRAYLFTSYGTIPGWTIRNQVLREFNGLGQVITEYQDHDGDVDTGSSEKVQYSYSEMASGANHSRLTSMTYPDGRVLEYQYDSGLDNNISRLSAIVDDDETVLEEYSYLGLGTVVIRAHPEPDVDLTYVQVAGDSDYNDDGGDQYTGFDRFGQLIDQFWIDASDDATDRFQYGYDRDGNRLSKDNLLHTDLDEDYTYDDLSRLVAMARADGFDQSWDQDAQGNFDEVDTDGTPESRTHNLQNEITVAGSANLSYDGNGNLTTDEQGRILIYDAWNRLVEVQDDQEETLVGYERDPQGRIVQRTADATTTDFYYTVAWQVVEEQVDEEAVTQYVRSPVYVDALILRDRDTDDNGTLDERLYVQQDANWNVTAVVNASGAVVERYVYTAYGERTVLEADWDVLGSSGFDFRQGHQGLTFEALIGLNLNRNREYSPTLMRFVANDPKGFAAGYTNLYAAYGNGPISRLDPLGLEDVLEQNRRLAAGRPVPPPDLAAIARQRTEQEHADQERRRQEFIQAAVANYLGLGHSTLAPTPPSIGPLTPADARRTWFERELDRQLAERHFWVEAAMDTNIGIAPFGGGAGVAPTGQILRAPSCIVQRASAWGAPLVPLNPLARTAPANLPLPGTIRARPLGQGQLELDFYGVPENVRGQGISTDLIRGVLQAQRASGNPITEVTGELALDNLRIYRETGDINATPIARSMRSLGYPTAVVTVERDMYGDRVFRVQFSR